MPNREMPSHAPLRVVENATWNLPLFHQQLHYGLHTLYFRTSVASLTISAKFQLENG